MWQLATCVHAGRPAPAVNEHSRGGSVCWRVLSSKPSRLSKTSKIDAMVAQYVQEYMKGTADPLKPFVGAKPKFLKEPMIATARESEAATRLACATITQRIMAAPGVLLVLAQLYSCGEARTRDHVLVSPVRAAIRGLARARRGRWRWAVLKWFAEYHP